MFGIFLGVMKVDVTFISIFKIVNKRGVSNYIIIVCEQLAQ